MQVRCKFNIKIEKKDWLYVVIVLIVTILASKNHISVLVSCQLNNVV